MSEQSLVRPLYERYRLLKELLLSSATPTLITTIVSREIATPAHSSRKKVYNKIVFPWLFNKKKKIHKNKMSR